ncbi:hypothetical protein [Dysgonomonas mossii]|uniref:Uncharacterized protein n=1 Tax=Dysgonomonas mossii DSM 22836 TaxID=742767 RepID=F8X578_9BACT|nr:hypothetical protein [Dysgonomonas mossii]EGK04684.1 hypothetical protein HMPREF9456_03387 [Dysgonomonas mossii DSM 22836]
MIHLTDKHIAVEIPEDATELEISYENPTHLVYKFGAEKIHDGFVKAEIVGVTPLTEQQIHSIVGSQFTKGTTYCGDFSIPYGYNISPKDRWDDIQRLKRLDPNKKYAIIKIEKE